MIRIPNDKHLGKQYRPNDSRWQLSPNKKAYVSYSKDNWTGSQWSVAVYEEANGDSDVIRNRYELGTFGKKDGMYYTKIENVVHESKKIPDMIYALYEAMLKNEKWKKSDEAKKARQDRLVLEQKLLQVEEERRQVLGQIYKIDAEFSKRLGT